MSKKQTPKTALLFVMNPKGGVGKTYFTYLLVQAFNVMGVKNLSVIEADPETLSITSALGEKNINDIKLADYDKVEKITSLKTDSFDEVVNLVGESVENNQGGVVVVDIGSNLYSQAVEYMRRISLEEELQLAGAEFWIASVAYMSPLEKKSTVAGIEDLCSTFHNVFVLDNNFDGGGKMGRFERTEEADVVEVIHHQKIANNMIESVSLAMADNEISSIQEGSVNPKLPFAKRSWLKQVYSLYFDQDNGMITSSNVVQRIANIGKGVAVDPIIEFHQKMNPTNDAGETDNG